MTIQLVIDSKFNNAGVKAAEAEIRTLAQSVERSLGVDNLIDQVRGGADNSANIAAIEKEIAKLNELSLAWRQKAIEAAAAGKTDVALGLQKEADAVDRTANSLRRMTEATKESNDEKKKSTGILELVNNGWSKFAFGLFVAQGTINTLTRLVSGLFNTLLDAASIADRAQSFNVLLADVGVNASALSAGLRQAGQGAITLDASMRPTLQLIKAGIPEIAGMSDQLLRIATSSAILSGDLSQTESMYTTLVRGIVRGSPLLIDNADIYLKLGDANEEYAASIGKTVEELSKQEKMIATARAVMEQGDAIVDLAEKVDSSALVFQQFKIDATDAWNSVRAVFGKGISETITALDDFMDMFDPIIVKLGELATGSEEVGFALERALDARPISTFVQSILTSLDLLGAYVRGYGAELTERWNAVVSVFVTGATLIAEGFNMITTGDYEKGMANINAQLLVFQGRVADAVDPHNQLNIEIEAAKERARATGEQMGLYGDALDEMGESAAAAADDNSALSNSFSQLSAGIQAAIEARTGLDAQYRDKKIDIEEGLRDKILDINKDLADRLGDINSDLRKKLVDIGEKYKDDVTKVAEDTAEKLADIDSDLADKLADLADKSQDDRVQATKNKQKSVENAHEQHQKKLADIERKYEASRMKALIDRDARALFEAEQNRKNDINSAADDLNDKVRSEEEKLVEQLERITELEEKRRQEAIKSAEDRRQDAIKAQADALADLKKALDKQREEAKKNADQQRRDAIQNATEARQEAQNGYRTALQDLDDWHREQLIRQREANLQRKISELEHLNEMGELTKAHLDELRSMYDAYNNNVSTTTSTAPSTGGGSPGGISSGDNTSNGGRWVRGPDGNLIFVPASQSSQPTSGTMKLQINSNDKMLDEVLKSSTYDYLIEALN